MSRTGICFLTTLLLIGSAISTFAQQTANIQANTVVPRVVNFSGGLTAANGKPLSGLPGVTFSIYKDSEGGAPLWTETQNVQADKAGRYSVVLGSTASAGLPSELFASGEARWLGVQPQGQAEQPRVLLMSVPYALKALDAETLGGRPASAFLAATGASGSRPAGNVTGSGTKDFIPRWTSTSQIGNSNIFENGSGQVGIATSTPAAKLDVNGPTDIRSTLTLFPNGGNPALKMSGSAFAINSAGKVTFISGQTFPGTGTITGVKAGSGLVGGGNTGNVTLALTNTCSSGQTLQWNGTKWVCSNAGTGTITGVTAQAPITGGGGSGNVKIGLTNACSNGQVLQWNSSSWVCSSAGSGTITGVTAGTDLTGGGNSGKVTLNLDTTKVPQLAAANTFSASQAISTSGTAASLNVSNASTGEGIEAGSTNGIAVFGDSARDSSFSSGILGAEDGTTTETIGVYGYTSSGTGMGVYGQNVSGSSVLFLPPYAGVWGDSSDGEGVVGTSDNYLAFQGINNTDGYPTMILQNQTSDSVFGTIFLAFDSNTEGSCTIDAIGDVSCSGQFFGGVDVEGGKRKVGMPSVGAAESWFEDAGSGQLSQGSAIVRLDSLFGQTVNTSVEYHVFLTPKGDCEGLYVSNETPEGFEVHELRHGQSSIAFDYRIMAKRKGFENVRLADVTAKMRIPDGPRGSKIQRQTSPTRVPSPKLSRPTNAASLRVESQVGRSLIGK